MTKLFNLVKYFLNNNENYLNKFKKIFFNCNLKFFKIFISIYNVKLINVIIYAH